MINICFQQFLKDFFQNWDTFFCKGTGEIMDQAYSEHYGPGSNVKPDRQKDAHAHGAFTFGPFVYVADLGSDKIWHYVVSYFSLNLILRGASVGEMHIKWCQKFS